MERTSLPEINRHKEQLTETKRLEQNPTPGNIESK